MTYTKTNWRDQLVERPKTYEFSNNSDGSVTLVESFGNVTELGTPVNAANMNHIEDGLALSDLMQYSASVTYSTGEWVTGTVNNVKGIYASKADNNLNNPLTDTTKWEKANIVDVSNKAETDFTNVNDTGKITGAGWAMPSGTYEELTIGASETEYTAPANGWFLLGEQNSVSTDAPLGLVNLTANIISTITRAVNGTSRRVYIPALKGDIVRITYLASANSRGLTFIYAKGSESEAS